ncbi:MAG: T9SS type A sorting domain-containing protein [candidate division WOR-3 bacterium]|nr:T9SS type A sorting domain-containing protein [candidate division WOR-3 bacterium]
MQAVLAVTLVCFSIWDADTHDVNNWILEVTNYGRLGGIGSYWLPESIPFYGAGVWFGTISPQSETLVTLGYGPHDGEAEFGPGLGHQNPLDPQVRVYMHPGDWPPNLDIFPMAPQIPLTVQESWSCYNDLDSNLHIAGDGRPIGIEIYQTTFADTFVSVDDVIFLKYEIKNCTTHTIENAIFAVMWDADCLEPAGFFNGLILHKWFYPSPQDSFLVENLGYFYGTTSIYSNDTVAAGVLFIKTPSNVGCTAHKLFTLNLEPNLDYERYLSMAGYNFRTGVYEPYDSLPYGPDDHRTLMSCGPFSIPPGGIEEIVIALIAAPYSSADTLMLAIQARDAKNLYCDSLMAIHEDEEQSSKHVGVLVLWVSPNPFSKLTTVSFGIEHSGERSALEGRESLSYGRDMGLKIYDACGRLVKSFFVPSSAIGYQSSVVWNGVDDACRRVPSGVYFIKLEAGDYSATKKVLLIR